MVGLLVGKYIRWLGKVGYKYELLGVALVPAIFSETTKRCLPSSISTTIFSKFEQVRITVTLIISGEKYGVVKKKS